MAPGDSPPLIDAPAIDAPIDTSMMPVVVARYMFDDDADDETDMHDATIVGSGMTYVAGRTGADEHAVRIPTMTDAHVRVPDHSDFDIAKGSIEVWFRFDSTAPTGDLGVFSRDATSSATGGHVGLRIGHDRKLVLRIQRMSDPTVEAYRCTAAAITPDVWHHVVITFGGSLTMEVDGAASTGTSWIDADTDSHDCSAAWTSGIDGNNNPWVFGGLTATSAEGTGSPVIAQAGTLQIDELVIRRLP